MKQKINVIDLDGTLIPFDSYSKFLLRTVKSVKFFIPTIILILFRKCRVIKLSTQKKYSIILNRKSKDSKKWIKKYAAEIYKNIDPDIMLIIEEFSDDSTKNILCTASPKDYAIEIAKLLDWECVASSYDGKVFKHLYGENKLKEIIEIYPQNEYSYNFSISDSKTDLALLKEFQNYKLIN